MMSADFSSRLARPVSRVGLVLLLLAVLLFLSHASAYRAWDEDDAYISFRYARHLAEGQGLVFNPGERVEGYSNPAWVLVSAAAMRAGLKPLATAQWLGMASGLLVLLLTWRLAARLQGTESWVAALGPLWLAATPILPRHAVTGLETVAFAAALLAAVHGLSRAEGRLHHLGGLVGLALLIFLRPEGMACALLVAGWRFLAHGRRDALGRQGLLLVVALIILLSGFRLIYFGALLPNTFHAKVSTPGRSLVEGVIYSVDFLRESGGGLLVGLFLAALLNPGGRRLWWLLTLAVGLQAAVVLAAGGDWMHFYRFYAPIYPLLVAGAAAGAVLLARALAGRTGRPVLVGGMMLAAVLVGWLNIYKVEKTVDRMVMVHVREEAYLTDAYRATGRWLRDNTAPEAKVAVSDIGLVGYESGRHIVDMFGLVDPHIARSEGRQHFKSDPQYVLQQRPDVIILVRDAEGGYLRIPDKRMDEMAAFHERYRLVQIFPVGFQDETVEVFRRQG